MSSGVGMVLLPAGAGGTIIGGLLVEKLRLNVRQIFRIQIAMSCLITASCVLFLLVCDTTKFAGVTVPYNASRSACYRHTSLHVMTWQFYTPRVGTERAVLC